MSMRIMWGSPWNEHSAIAKFGAEIVERLVSRGHVVEVLRTEVGQAARLPARPSAVPVRFWNDISAKELTRKVDVVIANFGNHYPFHGGMLQNFAQIGVVGIFHDSVLAHLAAGWAETSPNADAVLRRLVRATYGPDALKEGDAFWTDLATVARARPMLEWFASGVAGAVVHAQHYAELVAAVCPGPVKMIPMTFEFHRLPPPRPISDGELIVATIGMGNVNKRLDQVLAAIASSPRLRERCRYRLIGAIEPGEQNRLMQVSSSLGILPPEFTGWVTDEVLREKLADVDVLACLRYPVFEGGSASLLLSMQSGRPTLVSSHAAYAEVPDGLLLACKPGEETADVARHLEWVLENREAARSMGERARGYWHQTHSADRYVDALVPLLESAIACRPKMLAGQALGRRLATFGIDPNDPAVERIGLALGSLLGN